METKITIKKIYAIAHDESADYECAFTDAKRAIAFCVEMRERCKTDKFHVVEIETVTHTTETEMF